MVIEVDDEPGENVRDDIRKLKWVRWTHRLDQGVRVMSRFARRPPSALCRLENMYSSLAVAIRDAEAQKKSLGTLALETESRDQSPPG